VEEIESENSRPSRQGAGVTPQPASGVSLVRAQGGALLGPEQGEPDADFNSPWQLTMATEAGKLLLSNCGTT